MMRSILVLVCVLGFQISYDARAQEVNVVIENIKSDESISGYVEGMDAATMSHHRVVVYVHTDIWYIHPYVGQGEGLSWAAIRPDGTWVIETVRRRFRADRIGALVINENYPAPNTTRSLDRLQSVAKSVKILTGTEDYGKL